MPLLLCLYNDAVEGQVMPATIQTEILSLLPKPRKDRLDVKNYRPISLLNNDYKIFAKLLAKRLEEVISPLIHVDQVSIIPGCLLSNNMRRLFQIMHMLSPASSGSSITGC